MRKTTMTLGTIGLIAASWLVGPALASNLNGSSRTLGANSAAIGRCDTDGVTSVLNHEPVAPYRIVSVTVSGIASVCGGKTLRVTVNNGLINSSGSVTVPGSGGTVTVTLPTMVALRDATQTEISLA